MLVIKSIKFKYNKQLGTQRNKAVRISFGTNATVTRKKPIQLDGQTTEWAENITIPIFFNRPIDIEIFKPHQFGYNPQQLDSILSSSIKVVSFKQNSSEGIVYNIDKQQLGTLTLKYEIINEKLLKHQDQLPKAYINVTSILIHIDECTAEKGYCQFLISSESICAPEICFVSNEITFADTYSVPILAVEMDQKLGIRIYMDGVFKFQTGMKVSVIKKRQVKCKRIDLFDENKEIVGYIFIDLHYKDKQNGIKPEKQNLLSFPKLPHNPLKTPKTQTKTPNTNRNEVPSALSNRRSTKSHKFLASNTLEKHHQKKGRLYNLNEQYLLRVFDMGEMSSQSKPLKTKKTKPLDVTRIPTSLPKLINFRKNVFETTENR